MHGQVEREGKVHTWEREGESMDSGCVQAVEREGREHAWEGERVQGEREGVQRGRGESSGPRHVQAVERERAHMWGRGRVHGRGRVS